MTSEANPDQALSHRQTFQKGLVHMHEKKALPSKEPDDNDEESSDHYRL